MTRTLEPDIAILTPIGAGGMALVETVERRGDEPPCHRHASEDELLYVLEGELAVLVEGAWLAAPAGGAVMVPRGAEHTFAVVGDRARLLSIFAPAGFEGFFRDLGADRHWTPATVERWVTIAARYGCEITAPHPGRHSLPTPRS